MPSAARLPRASAAKVTYHLKQLGKMFARSDDFAFLQMIWAVDALQSGEVDGARAFITFPPQAADSSIGSPFAIHRWELETLIVQLLLTPKQSITPGQSLLLDCSKYESARETINRLRSLENVESAMYLAGDFDIFAEMHRIAQRQFHWQRGYFNRPQFYRYMYVYGQGQCAEYFEQEYGLPTTKLALAAFFYFLAYKNVPWLAQVNIPNLGLSREVATLATRLFAVSLTDAQTRTAEDVNYMNEQHGRPIPTAYLPSVLRRFPLICDQVHGDRFIAPIPEIILMRATSGLYYDLIGGGQGLLNEANDRFERYCAQLISIMMSQFSVDRAFRYGPRGSQIDSPDVIVRSHGRVILAAECKATKLTYLAQFAEDPFEAQRKQYQQISRGIFQLWRYFSHIRRGILNLELAPRTYAMVLTLDPFAVMSRHLRANIIQEASRLADEEGNISAEDRRYVIICPVQELEQVLCTSSEDIFLSSLEAAQEDRYVEWQFREIHRDTVGGNFGEARPFPFDLGELLPWWADAQAQADQWIEQQVESAQAE